MRLNSNAGVQRCTFDSSEAGEGLAVFFSQNGNASGRWRFLVQATLTDGVYDVGEFYSSPPNVTTIAGRLSRMLAGAICPGAKSWAVEVSCLKAPDAIPTDETATILLASSRCFTSPVGVTRVNERYAYRAGAATGITQNFTVLPGMTVTGIATVGLTGGGSVSIAGGNSIAVPANNGFNLAPGANIPPNSVIALTNVDWAIEYLESA